TRNQLNDELSSMSLDKICDYLSSESYQTIARSKLNFTELQASQDQNEFLLRLCYLAYRCYQIQLQSYEAKHLYNEGYIRVLKDEYQLLNSEKNDLFDQLTLVQQQDHELQTRLDKSKDEKNELSKRPSLHKKLNAVDFEVMYNGLFSLGRQTSNSKHDNEIAELKSSYDKVLEDIQQQRLLKYELCEQLSIELKQVRSDLHSKLSQYDREHVEYEEQKVQIKQLTDFLREYNYAELEQKYMNRERDYIEMEKNCDYFRQELERLKNIEQTNLEQNLKTKQELDLMQREKETLEDLNSELFQYKVQLQQQYESDIQPKLSSTRVAVTPINEQEDDRFDHNTIDNSGRLFIQQKQRTSPAIIHKDVVRREQVEYQPRTDNREGTHDNIVDEQQPSRHIETNDQGVQCNLLDDNLVDTSNQKVDVSTISKSNTHTPSDDTSHASGSKSITSRLFSFFTENASPNEFEKETTLSSIQPQTSDFTQKQQIPHSTDADDHELVQATTTADSKTSGNSSILFNDKETQYEILEENDSESADPVRQRLKKTSTLLRTSLSKIKTLEMDNRQLQSEIENLRNQLSEYEEPQQLSTVITAQKTVPKTEKNQDILMEDDGDDSSEDISVIKLDHKITQTGDFTKEQQQEVIQKLLEAKKMLTTVKRRLEQIMNLAQFIRSDKEYSLLEMTEIIQNYFEQKQLSNAMSTKNIQGETVESDAAIRADTGIHISNANTQIPTSRSETFDSDNHYRLSTESETNDQRKRVDQNIPSKMKTSDVKEMRKDDIETPAVIDDSMEKSVTSRLFGFFSSSQAKTSTPVEVEESLLKTIPLSSSSSSNFAVPSSAQTNDQSQEKLQLINVKLKRALQSIKEKVQTIVTQRPDLFIAYDHQTSDFDTIENLDFLMKQLLEKKDQQSDTIGMYEIQIENLFQERNMLNEQHLGEIKQIDEQYNHDLEQLNQLLREKENELSVIKEEQIKITLAQRNNDLKRYETNM
ncbi:unnamed protein product, partial [Didymodactylos carnosus]